MLDFSSDYWPSLSAALVGVLGVMLGVVVTAYREQRRWKKDQVLRAAVDFVGATGAVYDDRRGRNPHTASPEERQLWHNRLQDARSTLFLLCDVRTVELVDRQVNLVRNTDATFDGTNDDAVLDALREFTKHVRSQL